MTTTTMMMMMGVLMMLLVEAELEGYLSAFHDETAIKFIEDYITLHSTLIETSQEYHKSFRMEGVYVPSIALNKHRGE